MHRILLSISFLLVLSCEETTSPEEQDGALNDTKPPVVQIISPVDSTTVFDTLQYINVIAIDDYGLDTLFLFVDDSSVDSIIIGETYERTELARDDSYDEDDTEFLFYWNTTNYTDSTWYDVFIQAKDSSNNIGYSDSISLFLSLNLVENPLSAYRLAYATHEGIYRTNADGTNNIKISDDNAIDLLSTDDKIIYSSSTEFGQTEIYSMNFDGTERVRLTYSSESEEILDFTENGDKIIYNISNQYNTMLLNGSNQELLFDFPNNSFVSTTFFDLSLDQWGNEGLMVSDICTNCFNYDNCSCCEMQYESHFYANIIKGNISYLGNKFAYIQKTVTGGNLYYFDGSCGLMDIHPGYNWYHVSTLYTMDIDSTNISSLTDAQFSDIYSVKFSPNGENLFFIGENRENPVWEATIVGLYSINTDGGDINLLTNNIDATINNNIYDTSPMIFSSDGELILYIYDNDIFLINSDGSSETNITISSFYEQKPRFSPDGELIGFISNRDNNDDIFFINNGDEPDISTWHKLEFDITGDICYGCSIRNFIFLPNP